MLRSLGLLTFVAVSAGGCALILGLDEFVDAPPEAGAGGGGAGMCASGESRPCYTGPEGTEGIGLCHAGEQACLPDRTGFGACDGEVTPSGEDCAVPGDEDCDGVGCSDLVWARIFGGADVDVVAGPAVDSEGNIALAGSFMGTASFGGAPLVSAGKDDAFLAKLDPDGNHQWSRRFGNANIQQARGVKVDHEGNLIVTGDFLGSIDLGGGAYAASNSDIFVAKFDPSGNHLWSRQIAGGIERVYSLVLTTTDDVVIVGLFNSTLDVGNDPLINGDPYDDVFIAKLSGADGSSLWSKSFSVTSEHFNGYVQPATDSSDNIYLAGKFHGTVAFGPSPLVSQYADAFLVKLDADGNHSWSQQFGDGELQQVTEIIVDGFGQILAMGMFRGTIDFGGGALSAPGFDNINIFLAKMSTTGEHLWSRGFGGDGQDLPAGIAPTDQGGFFFMAGVSKEIDLGAGVLRADDGFTVLARFDAEGDVLWSKQFSSAQGGGAGRLVLVPTTGEVVMAGGHRGTVDYGSGPLTESGMGDIVVAKFSP